jgi:hypothetical protein
MELRNALQHAVALAGTSGVVGFSPEHVLTSHASMVCSIALDAPLPCWGVVEAKALSMALRDVQGEPELKADGPGFLLRANGSVAFLKAVDAPIPAPPVPPRLTPVEDWDVIARVFHAAGAGAERPELACIRFAEDVTEATDCARIARVDIGIGHGELVPVSSFGKLRAGPAHVAFADSHAFFQFGDELRVSSIVHSWYPSLHAYVPSADGIRIRVPKKAFEKAVAKAGRAAAKSAVKLCIVGSHVTVARLSFGTRQLEFETRIEIVAEEDESAEFILNGKMLRDAIKVLPGAEITIIYSKAPNAPIRFEADRYVEVLYPLGDL